jgi:hypothetical protein
MKIIKEKILNKEESLEYQIIQKTDSPYLVKLINDSFHLTDEYYCFVIEYCEVFAILFPHI